MTPPDLYQRLASLHATLELLQEVGDMASAASLARFVVGQLLEEAEQALPPPHEEPIPDSELIDSW